VPLETEKREGFRDGIGREALGRGQFTSAQRNRLVRHGARHDRKVCG